MDVPRDCGLLSEKELEITERTAVDLVKRLAKGELTAVEVTAAFCKRAAIAHQMVRFRQLISTVGCSSNVCKYRRIA